MGSSSFASSVLLLILLSVIPNTLVLVNGDQEKVSVSLYYESLCPYCADFIVNHLAELFQNGLISVVNLRLIPWGNSWFNPDGSFSCQHGPDECLLNTVHACAIASYPEVELHFKFIHCVERFTLANRHSEWPNCFGMTNLSRTPIDHCYQSGYGQQLEKQYAAETAALSPPHRFVPWVVVNNQALQEDFEKLVNYICKAYRGNPVPQACRSLHLTDQTANPISVQACYASNSTL